ncbi:MAG: hypothetical protein ACW99F_15480 [Candidatus Hodarchaeales archaeon]
MTIMKSPFFDSNKSEKNFHFSNEIEGTNTWYEDLVSLYIVRKDDGICLYSHHFNLGYISRIENQLVGMGFVAIISMIREVVDSESQLESISLGRKTILVESREGILSILVVKRSSPIIKEKLKKFAIFFNHLFELQQQINKQSNLVCREDYALTTDLIHIIFSIPVESPLKLIPLIFKVIQANPSKKLLIKQQLSKISSHDVSTESMEKEV